MLNISDTTLKYVFFLLSITSSSSIISQTCNCNKDPELSSIISCDTVVFNNTSKLLKQFNCDSSWLVFEDRFGKRKILYSLKAPLMELSDKLGYQYVAEFQKSFFIENRTASGCCSPAEYLLFDKGTGELINNFGRIIHYATDSINAMVIYYDHASLNYIHIYEIDSGKNYLAPLPKGRISFTMNESDELYPEGLIKDANISGSTITIHYKYLRKNHKQKWYDDKILIDLKSIAGN